MNSALRISSAETSDDLANLRVWAASRGAASAALERHLARPRYRPALTRIVTRAGEIVGYVLMSHKRLRLGAATLETGRITALDLDGPAQDNPDVFTPLLGDCLRVLVEEQLPLALVSGAAEAFARFGFAPYAFLSQVQLAPTSDIPHGIGLRRATADDLDDLAALYDACYQALPLTPIRSAPDWRFWLADGHRCLVAEDNRGRVAAYAAIDPEPTGNLVVAEAAAADAGAARMLCHSLQSYAHTHGQALLLELSPWHIVAQVALHLNGTVRITAHSTRGIHHGQNVIAGVVDLPLLLEALAPEFERRLAGSRYAGWSGNLRLEIETERITLAFAEGRATMIDGSRPADLRLRQITLPALAQLCLGYRVAADLRATAGLACDDSALGLLDALFPAVLAVGTRAAD
jgi:hypothetical protein